MSCGATSRAPASRCGRTSSAVGCLRRTRRADAARSGKRFAAVAACALSRERLGGETLMVNELYLAVLLSAGGGTAATGLSARVACARAARRPGELSLPMRSTPARSSRRRCRPRWRATSPRLLGIYRSGTSGIRRCSSTSALLVNGERQRMPLPRGPAQRGAGDHALVLRHRGHRVPSADRAPGSGDARHQGVPDAEHRRHVQPAAVGAVCFRADAVVHVSVARRPVRHCCSASSTAWPTPATSRSRRLRS